MNPAMGILQWVMSQTNSIVDAAVGESIMTKTYEEAYDLMEKLAFNHLQMVYERTEKIYIWSSSNGCTQHIICAGI